MRSSCVVNWAATLIKTQTPFPCRSSKLILEITWLHQGLSRLETRSFNLCTLGKSITTIYEITFPFDRSQTHSFSQRPSSRTQPTGVLVDLYRSFLTPFEFYVFPNINHIPRCSDTEMTLQAASIVLWKVFIKCTTH